MYIYVHIFFSVVPRRIFMPVDWYECPNIEPKCFRTRFVKIPYARL